MPTVMTAPRGDSGLGCSTGGRMRIQQSIHRLQKSIRELHPGQVAILVLIGATAVALMLPVRRHAAGSKRFNESGVWATQRQLDSLNRLVPPPPLHRDSLKDTQAD